MNLRTFILFVGVATTGCSSEDADPAAIAASAGTGGTASGGSSGSRAEEDASSGSDGGPGGATGTGGSFGSGGLDGSGGSAGERGRGCTAVGGTGGNGLSVATVPSCSVDAECGDGRCMEIVEGSRACTLVPQPAPVAETCSQFPEDECGCPGRTCTGSEECRLERAYLGAASGAPAFRKVCGLDQCESNADCSLGELCIPPLSAVIASAFSRCYASPCVSGSDCAGCGGRCVILAGVVEQGQLLFRGPSCR